MTIQKYLHSCLLLKKKGKRLLIDPGNFSFREGEYTPEDIGPVDAILISHQHVDHFDPKILKQFMELGPAHIWTIREIGDLLAKEGIPYELVEPGEKYQIADFAVDVYAAEHGALPIPIPDNVAFHIDSTLFHPGDSYDPQGIENVKVLALPVAGPWSRLVDALDMVDRLGPEVVIPIHDAIIKDFMLERIYSMLKTALDERGVLFRPLESGEVLDNP